MAKIDPIEDRDGEARRLVARYRRPLMSFFLRRVEAREVAEDLTQEVFLRLVRRDEPVPDDNPETFIFRIAANLLRDRHRRPATHRVADHDSLDESGAEVRGGVPIARNLVEDRGPERVLLSQESLTEVLKALDELGGAPTPGPQSSKSSSPAATFLAERQAGRGPLPRRFAGGGQIDFDLERAVTATGDLTTAEREGDLVFGSIASGFERRREGWLVSSYGRVEFARADLGAYAEQGGGLYNLSYASREVTSLVGALGVRGEFTHEVRFGLVRPRARLEVLHEFEDEAGQEIRYADWLGRASYLIPGAGSSRNRIRLGVGNAAVLSNGWTVDFDAEADVGDDEVLGTFRLKALKAF